jgi:hypothetical protein
VHHVAKHGMEFHGVLQHWEVQQYSVLKSARTDLKEKTGMRQKHHLHRTNATTIS